MKIQNQMPTRALEALRNCENQHKLKRTESCCLVAKLEAGSAPLPGLIPGPLLLRTLRQEE
jgi:hypothetical protein